MDDIITDDDRAHALRTYQRELGGEERDTHQRDSAVIVEPAKGHELGSGGRGSTESGARCGRCDGLLEKVRSGGEREASQRQEIKNLADVVDVLGRDLEEARRANDELAAKLNARGCHHPVIVEDTGLLRTIRRAQELRIADLDGRLRAAHDSLASTDKLLAERTTARDEAHAWLRALLDQIPGGDIKKHIEDWLTGKRGEEIPF